IDEDFEADPRVIPGARRFPFDEITALVPELAGNMVVIICQKGLKLSAGASAWLRAEGVDARYLQGGNFAWRDSGGPLIPFETMPNVERCNQSVWVASNQRRISIIACAWLIRRFVDRDARFLFVSPSQIDPVAEKFAATPIKGSKGESPCLFMTMLDRFHLRTGPLLKISSIVHAIENREFKKVREAGGVFAVLDNLSNMYVDDIEYLEASLLVHDALYRWACNAGESDLSLNGAEEVERS
ncbi:MAG: chromate resistance protein ChrB domain-containing protein, partial [Pseudomonadota bacterium]